MERHTHTQLLSTPLPLGLLELPNGSVFPVLRAQLGSWVIQTRFSSVCEISVSGQRRGRRSDGSRRSQAFGETEWEEEVSQSFARMEEVELLEG